jgi:hypothetical protein
MTQFFAPQPHGPIQEISDGVFWVHGSIRMGPGVRIARNMAIVTSGDELAVISAVRLDDDGEAALAKLGSVRHVIKLGAFHGIDDAYYLFRYGAAYWSIPGAARPQDPPPDRALTADSLPIADAELFTFDAATRKEGALLIKRAGGILITCDAVQHWPDTAGCSLAAKVVSRLLGFTRRPAQIGPPWRKQMTPEGGSLRGDFERLAALEFKHLIGGHGSVLRDTARDDLRATIAATFGAAPPAAPAA